MKIKENAKLKNCYNLELAISKQKYKDLKNLCETLAIKLEYHKEYLTLKTNNKVEDRLDETDEEEAGQS